MDHRNMLKATSVVPIVSSFLAPPSATRTNSAPTHTCLVGANGPGFLPNQLTADVGDIIEYQFFPQNHSVARAAFGNNLACIPYENSGSNLVGFWSGFVPLSIVESNPPVFRLRINDTQPIFFYCAAPRACQEGMIGVINPNSTFTYHAQLAYALNTSISLSPLESFPAEVSGLQSATVTESMTMPMCTMTSSSSSCAALSGGSIAGIVIGSLVVTLLAAASLYLCGRQKTIREILRQSQPSSSEPHSVTCSDSPNQNFATGKIHADGMGYPLIPNVRNMHHPADAMISDMHSDGTTEGLTKQQTLGSLDFPDSGIPIPVYAPHSQEMAHTASTASTAASADEIRPYIQHSEGVDSGPHELPAIPQGPSAPVLVEADENSSRPFSFTESDRGWHPRNHKAGFESG